MKLYLLSRHDLPHAQSQTKPAQSVCGVPLVGAKEITEAQALVFLGDLRCQWCCPSHKYHVLKKAVAA